MSCLQQTWRELRCQLLKVKYHKKKSMQKIIGDITSINSELSDTSVLNHTLIKQIMALVVSTMVVLNN